MLLFPPRKSRPPILLFLRYHRARSHGPISMVVQHAYKIINVAYVVIIIAIVRGQLLLWYLQTSASVSTRLRVPYSFPMRSRYRTFWTDQLHYVWTVRSGCVDDLRLLPPEFSFIQIQCRFNTDTFDDKYHKHCPGRGEFTAMTRASFVNVETAVQCHARDEHLYWCKHCECGSFFPPSCPHRIDVEYQ
jgi:hypothetical protein